MALLLVGLFLIGLSSEIFLIVIIHELGHAVTARLVGLHVHQIILLGFRFDWTSDGWVRSWDWRWTRPAGLIRTAEGSEAGWRYVLMVLGGPAANLATTALSVGILGLISMLLKKPVSPAMSVAIATLTLFAFLNSMMTLATLIPGKAQGLHTDGGQLWDIFRAWYRRRR